MNLSLHTITKLFLHAIDTDYFCYNSHYKREKSKNEAYCVFVDGEVKHYTPTTIRKEWESFDDITKGEIIKDYKEKYGL